MCIFIFCSRCCCCQSFFLSAALILLLVLVLLTTSALKQREVPATVSSIDVTVLYTATLWASIAAVVLGCFYFCPSDCDASVMVVDCAAVETGCSWKNTYLLKVASKYVLIFIFWSRCCCCCCCCVLLLLPTTSVLKRREVPATVSSFSVCATTTAISFASISLLLLL